MKTFLIIAMLLSAIASSNAQNAPTDYRQVMRDCGASWKASDARKAVTKGQGMQAWQDYRRECVKTSGYVRKANRSAATTN